MLWSSTLELAVCLWGSSVLSSAAPAEDIIFEALPKDSADPQTDEGYVVPSMFVLHAKTE